MSSIKASVTVSLWEISVIICMIRVPESKSV